MYLYLYKFKWYSKKRWKNPATIQHQTIIMMNILHQIVKTIKIHLKFNKFLLKIIILTLDSNLENKKLMKRVFYNLTNKLMIKYRKSFNFQS